MPWHRGSETPRTNASAAVTVWKAVGLAGISGLRSASGPALLSRAAARDEVDLEDTPFGFLGRRKVAAVLQIMALGELIGDKLPATPSRTAVPPLLGRTASGALVGAALFASEGRRLPAGALLGAASAVAAAFAGERLRSAIVEKSGAPDPLVAVAEDAVVLAVGLLALRRAR